MVNGPSSLIDTHCHLDLHQFDDDRAAVIDRAKAAGVETIINPAIDLDSCRRALALAEQHPNIYAAVGVHPNDCASFDENTLVALRELARHPKVVAVGEIGLDYYWEQVPHGQQTRALRDQLALATELNLPVILHCRNPRGGVSRECSADLLRELEQWVSATRTRLTADVMLGVWHAFSGGFAEAQAAYDLGLALGLGGTVTFLNARRLHELVPQFRFDRLMLETDAPYLAPHPYRGQRNEPAYVPLIVESLARLYATTPEAVAARTTATVGQCFRLSKA